MLHNKRVLSGRVAEARRYWIKLTAGRSTYYINKAWIVYVQPLKLTAPRPKGRAGSWSYAVPTIATTLVGGSSQ